MGSGYPISVREQMLGEAQYIALLAVWSNVITKI